MDYTPDWNIRSIPDDLLNSEAARRRVAKRLGPGNIKLEPCTKCGKELTARQRRLKCPEHGIDQPD